MPTTAQEVEAAAAGVSSYLKGSSGRQLLSVGGLVLVAGLFVLAHLARNVVKSVRKARRRHQGFHIVTGLQQREEQRQTFAGAAHPSTILGCVVSLRTCIAIPTTYGAAPRSALTTPR